MDRVPAQMLLVNDILSPDGEIRVIGSEKSPDGFMITLTLMIGDKEHKTHLAYDVKVPIYNYT